ncbi:hypothetical protein VF05_09210 [Nostoc linckia z3]|nr:hypothetical protein VF05_09210 [Nostoc linckia z3]
MGHWAWGRGQGAWGIGHGAWGIGHWALVLSVAVGAASRREVWERSPHLATYQDTVSQSGFIFHTTIFFPVQTDVETSNC